MYDPITIFRGTWPQSSISSSNMDEERQGFAHDGPATASCSMQEPAVQGRSATLLRVKDSNITVSLVEF